MATKLTTVITNKTRQKLTLRVGNRNWYTKLATIEIGGHYEVKIDVNWTYQEFRLEGANCTSGKKLIVSSDDCCDYECITIKESLEGTFELHRVARGRTHSFDARVVVQIQSSWTSWFRWPSLITWGFWSRK